MAHGAFAGELGCWAEHTHFIKGQLRQSHTGRRRGSRAADLEASRYPSEV